MFALVHDESQLFPFSGNHGVWLFNPTNLLGHAKMPYTYLRQSLDPPANKSGIAPTHYQTLDIMLHEAQKHHMTQLIAAKPTSWCQLLQISMKYNGLNRISYMKISSYICLKRVTRVLQVKYR